MIIFMTMIVILVALIPIIWRRDADWFSPIYVATGYFMITFPIHSLYAFFNGTHIMGDPSLLTGATYEAWIISLIYLVIGYSLVLLAYRSDVAIAMVRVFPRLPVHWQYRKSIVLMLLLILISGISYYFLIQTFGGVLFYLTNMYVTRTTWGTGYLNLLTGFVNLAFLISYINFLYKKRIRFMMFLLFVICVAVNSSTGSRGAVLGFLLSAIVVYYYIVKYHLHQMVRLKMRFVLFVIVMLFVMTVFNLYRNAPNVEEAATKIRSVNALNVLFEPLQRAYGMDSLTVIVRDVPRDMDYQLGQTIVPIIYTWIPRNFWEDKPITSPGKIYADTLFSDWYGGTNSAVALTLFGDAYLNFHVFGIIGFALIAGVLLRGFYLYCNPRQSIPGLFVYAANFSSLFMFWENSVEGSVASYLPVVLTTVIIALGLGKRELQ